MESKKVSVIGLGYIGLPTAALFASRKIRVVGVDINMEVVDTINRGEIHIVEPDLDMLVNAAVVGGYLRATTSPEASDAFIIAVPTPFRDGKKPDLSYVETATRMIADVLKKGDLVILESTSPVGTTEQVAEWLAAARQDLTFPHQVGESSDIRLAHCPERVLPGQILRELVQNDRVIGGITQKCSAEAVKLYKAVVNGECIVSDARTAEMCKLTENSYRDVNIAFANELSLICDQLGINVWELIRLANRHPRVDILQPGPGVGGHCIAVDPWFIVSKTPDKARLIRMAREVNDDKPYWVVEKIKTKATRFKHPVIGCLGITFKANIDDLRESPALEIVRDLMASDVGHILVCDPHCTNMELEFPIVELNEVVVSADILVVLVDHQEFKNIRPDTLKEKIIIDTRGIWS
ncbi:UDP-N-acetyl-D-mannosamine dehydrogenase [Geobacter sulfurreducens]|uniref:NDP-N-acetyl-D-galactosamine 6-dehydrogenase, putative n=1 Tax=Geobacter sulfurreducens (strain ATCC 51573 / DSM 12127 / PCA) TaxID=243231 RepID=Q74C21_GEOSL|nr:UDP-N-acetyl-D-mannosamine dehydrogenase [Geobacter sulfurreducens]AAR35231.1 NDP-N-acetyl-D-galactosamine 6-dehydrogenase, putative [Geobacter sulfurreducens PCA]UAC02597.1 UDP-N-acetyl-D-mannosamine dehydrogenase [Geobacter sulfurreducens]